MRARRTLAAVVPGLLLACAAVRPPAPPQLFPAEATWGVRTPGVLSAPLVTDGTRLIASSRDGTLSAFNLADGADAWRVTGRAGWLAMEGRQLIVRQADGTAWSVDPASGSARWKATTGVAGATEPVIVDQTVVIAGKGVAGISLKDGRALWGANDGSEAVATPVVWQKALLTTEADGTVRSRDRTTGATLWTARTAAPLVASPALDEPHGLLLVGTTDGRLLALDLKDGRERWHWKVGADVHTRPAAFARRALFTTLEAVLYGIDAGNGHLSWRVPLPSRPLSGPILSGSAVVVACYENEVLGFDASTGDKLGSMIVPGEMQTAPIVVGDRLFVGLRDRSLVSYQLGVVKPPPSPSPSPAAVASPAASPGMPVPASSPGAPRG